MNCYGRHCSTAISAVPTVPTVITIQQCLNGQFMKFASPANASLLLCGERGTVLLGSDVAAISQAHLCEDLEMPKKVASFTFC